MVGSAEGSTVNERASIGLGGIEIQEACPLGVRPLELQSDWEELK